MFQPSCQESAATNGLRLHLYPDGIRENNNVFFKIFGLPKVGQIATHL